MNKTLATKGRDYLKEMLNTFSKPQQKMFKRMYAPSDLDRDINECVDNMDDSKIDWAITQCERTAHKNSLNK